MHGEAEGSSDGGTFFSFLSFFFLRAQCLLGLLRGDLAGFLDRGRVRFGGNVGVGIGGIITEIAYSATLRWEVQRVGVIALAGSRQGFVLDGVLPFLDSALDAAELGRDVKARLEAGCLHALRCILPHFEILASRKSATRFGCVSLFVEDDAHFDAVGGYSCTGVSSEHGVVRGDFGAGVSAFVAYERVSRGDVAGRDGRSSVGASSDGSDDRRLWRVPNVERGHGTTSRFGAPWELAVWSLVGFAGRAVGTIPQDMAFLLAMMACRWRPVLVGCIVGLPLVGVWAMFYPMCTFATWAWIWRWVVPR